MGARNLSYQEQELYNEIKELEGSGNITFINESGNSTHIVDRENGNDFITNGQLGTGNISYPSSLEPINIEPIPINNLPLQQDLPLPPHEEIATLKKEYS